MGSSGHDAVELEPQFEIPLKFVRQGSHLRDRRVALDPIGRQLQRLVVLRRIPRVDNLLCHIRQGTSLRGVADRVIPKQVRRARQEPGE